MIDHERARELLRRPAFLATVAAVTVVLVVGGLVWNAGRPVASVADASHPPQTASPAASANTDPWASLEPSASFAPLPGDTATPAAILTALGARGPVVPIDAGFRLASVDATPASRLATRLTVRPDFAFSVKPEADDRAVLLTPAVPLQPGVVYRFSLSGASGESLDSWAFQARQPLHVATTLPADQATDVPVDTGIEITFDQDGVVDAAAHITIMPATSGRFEQHGRTTAFVPGLPLRPATLYTVTVSRGVAVAGTGEATETDTRLQFETASTASSTVSTFAFADQVVESPTAERPTIGLWAFGENPVPPKTVRIEVYRLANLDAGVAAFRALRTRPDWSRWSTDGLVDTKGLQRVVAIDTRLNPSREAFWVQLPNKLPAGWYLVQQPIGTRPSQTVLQVTDVAGYLAVSDTRTLVWANDLKTRRPIVGATVASDGTRIGRTDARGLAVGTTPKVLLAESTQTCALPCVPVVTVRTTDGRQIFLPATSDWDMGGDWMGFGSAGDPGYWSLLHTDRSRYRPTDTVNVWGVVRNRANGKVPSTVTIRVTAQSYGSGDMRPPVATLTAKPGPTGAFLGSLTLAGLAEGDYAVDLLVGSRVVRTSGISVGPIAKPAYRLEVETGRRVYIEGDRIKITARATFYEGTPVPAVPLRINGVVERDVTTDASGTAIYRTTATAIDPNTGPEGQGEGPRQASLGVAPARAEEGEIAAASRDFLVFPSTRTIDASARIAQGKVRVTGAVHLVAIARLEAEIAGGRSIWDLDPRGAAVRSATVTVRFVELIPHRTQTGTDYDFIEKKAVPRYDTSIVERAAGSVRVKSAANGTYTASIPAPNNDHDYKVLVSVGDAAGHIARTSGFANRHPWTAYGDRATTLRPTDAGADPSATFSIGDRVDLTLIDPDTKQAAGDGTRYLFFRAQLGIRDATVQSSSRYLSTFARWAAPNLYIDAVRFTGRGYTQTQSFAARFRVEDRSLQVGLAARAARYAPGELASIDVTTRTASGAPTAATVILRAVDEKLFAIGAASQDDALAELYDPLSSGILGTYRSHRNPRGQFGGGGDAGGGGRDDFRDSLLFKMISTDSHGRGSVSFRVSDDLTSWRVNASAITSRLEAGSGSVLVPVGLPFFVDASIAAEYLLADRPSIVVRAFGSAVAAGDAVTIGVTSTSLAYDSGPIKAVAFATTAVPLPPLRLGTQSVTISATTGRGATLKTDRLTRSFTVVETHLTTARSTHLELPTSDSFSGGDGLTTVVVADASTGRYLPLLTDLASGGGARLDRGLAADVASSLLATRFGPAPAYPEGGTFAASRYQAQDGGLALLPYSSSDVELSALVAIVAPDRVNRNSLGSYLQGIRANLKETRERQMFALAGLAGLGNSILPALRLSAADPDLTIRERLMIGLGAAALGDAATARSIAAALTADHAERLGEQARLRVGTSAADITTATALMAVLTAAVGDSRAPLFWAYVEANPAVDQLQVLPAVAYVMHILDRLPVQPASFAYTLDGTRTVVALLASSSFELTLTAARLASLKIERITGSIGVTTTWREPIRPTALQPDPDVTISRTVKPSATIASADLITVDLTVTFGPQAATGCHQVTELVPSGLTPVGLLAAWIDPGTENAGSVPADGVVSPYDQSGARVFFCAEPTAKLRTVPLRYYARVVTPGTYAWEPAIAESRSQEGHAALTSAGEIVIR